MATAHVWIHMKIIVYKKHGKKLNMHNITLEKNLK